MKEPSTWPAVTYEEREWESVDGAMSSRRQLRQHRGPYRAAITPEIRLAVPSLSMELLAEVDDATSAIARFDADVGASLLPFAPLLLRSESASSSHIENLTASAKAIALAEMGDRSRANAALIVANSAAMQAALDLADRMDGPAIIEMHRVLLGDSNPQWVGRWRTEQVWVGGTSLGPHQADFVPPHADRVPNAIDDLVAFLDRDDLPLLVQSAIGHAQFESIHPFPDGNGRVGRALVHARLRSTGLTRSVLVPISAGLLQRRTEYFDALSAYRNGDVAPIVAAFARSAHVAVINGRHLVEDLGAVRAEWGDRVSARQGSAARRLLDTLIAEPVVTSASVQRLLGVSAPTAGAAIEHLVGTNVLHKVAGRERNRAWAALEVLDALDAFADRVRRPHL